MNGFLRIFSFAFVIGAALAKHHHHQQYDDHHHHDHHHGLRGYAAVSHDYYSPAVVAKAAPVYAKGGTVVYSKAAPVAYAHAHSPVLYKGAVAALPAAPVAYLNGGHHHGYNNPHHHHHAQAAYAYAAPIAPEHYALLTTAGKPKVYGQSIPAAAIRNVETVMVTKTITPVVTKTTTHHTRAEPALSLGHVQGYNQAAVGHPKIAPVQFNTAYTSYANPTVGINGPVVYSGPAIGLAPGIVGAGPVAGGVVGPQPVLRSGVAGAYAYLPGAALAYDSYGHDAHAAPVTNFLELRSGKPVYAAAAVSPYGYAHKK